MYIYLLIIAAYNNASVTCHFVKNINRRLMQNAKSHSLVFLEDKYRCASVPLHYIKESRRGITSEQYSDGHPPHVPSCLDSTNNLSIIRPAGLDLRWPTTYTGGTQELAYEPGRPKYPTLKVISHYDITIIYIVILRTSASLYINTCFMYAEFHR